MCLNAKNDLYFSHIYVKIGLYWGGTNNCELGPVCGWGGGGEKGATPAPPIQFDLPACRHRSVRHELGHLDK